MPGVKVRKLKNKAEEDKIQHTLEKREREGIRFQDLAIEFVVLCSTLDKTAKQGKACQKAHEEELTLPPAIENALAKWA